MKSGVLQRAAALTGKAALLRNGRGRFSVGEGCRIPFRTLHVEAERLEIGNHVILGERTILKGGRFCFSDYVWCGDDVQITGVSEFSIGKFGAVASRVTFLLGKGSHRLQSLSPYPFRHRPEFSSPGWTRGFDVEAESRSTCRVGHDVWIGTGSIVLPNIAIGTGAVVSAGSVVARDVPPYAVVGGNPAQIISFRFKPSLIRELLELRWWDWPPEKIRRNTDLFTRNLTTRATLEGVPIVH